MTEHFPTRPLSLLSLWRLFFGSVTLQGVVVAAAYLSTNSQVGLIMGLSKTRLGIIAGVLVLTASAAWQLAATWIRSHQYNQRANDWADWLSQPVRWGYLTLLSGIIGFMSVYQLTLFPDISEPFTRGFLGRLLPIVAWIAGVSIQMFVLLIYLGRVHGLITPNGKSRAFRWFLIYFVVVFLLWFWVSRTIHPLASSRVGWNWQGVPIIEVQLLLAWGAGIAALLLINRLSSTGKSNNRLFDLAVSVFLCTSATILWQSTPISPNWFVSEKIPPNFTHYPYSDARAYDVTAQSALIGEGYKFFNGLDVRRPLHAAYLTLLHLAAGQDYERVIFLQVLILSLMPVAVYFTAKYLHNRASGVAAASIIILREHNSISSASSITTSHVKLMMVDMPTAFLAVIFIYLVIRWLTQVERRSLPALIAGGAIGISMLMRLETVFFSLVPLLIVSFQLLTKKRFGWYAKHIALFSLGVVLVISPWVWRNWQRTGMLFIDSPVFRYSILIQRFRPAEAAPKSSATSVEGTSTPEVRPVPTTAVSTPLPVDLEMTGRNYLCESLKSPGEVVGIFSAHFLNSQIQMLLIFPGVYRVFDSSIELIGHRDLSAFSESCCSLNNTIRRLPFWHKWDGRFPSQTILPVLVIVLVISVGLTTAWKRRRTIGLMPAFIVLSFICFYALLRNSGGRYILPVDWVSIMYFGIGLIQLSVNAVELAGRYKLREELHLQQDHKSEKIEAERLLRLPKFYGVGLFFIIVGSFIPLLESAFSPRYPPAREAKMLEMLMESEILTQETRSDLKAFLEQGGTAMAGRALYPLYYPSGFGSPDPDEGPLMTKAYPRLTFNLTGRYSLDMALPTEKRPGQFPNAADALAMFCLSDNPLRAEPLALALFDDSGGLSKVYLRASIPESPGCPLPSYSDGKP